MLLGIDIGGTTINLGLVEGGQIVRSETIPSFSPDATKAQTVSYLADAASKLLSKDVESIGIGVPTLVDPVSGVVFNATNIPSWDEVPLKAELESRLGVPVFVNNDSNCFALGASALVGKGAPVLVGITLGTGLGMGVIWEGKLLSGTQCGVGELGSVPYNGADYEAFCSKKFFHDRGISPRQASEAVEKGDKDAALLYWEFGHHMGELLSLVMYAYQPDCIVLGGGVSKGYPHFCQSMMEILRSRYPYARALDTLRIEILPQGDVPVLGASLLSKAI